MSVQEYFNFAKKRAAIADFWKCWLPSCHVDSLGSLFLATDPEVWRLGCLTFIFYSDRIEVIDNQLLAFSGGQWYPPCFPSSQVYFKKKVESPLGVSWCFVPCYVWLCSCLQFVFWIQCLYYVQPCWYTFYFLFCGRDLKAAIFILFLLGIWLKAVLKPKM